MAKAVRYKDGTLMMPGSHALELYEDKSKDASKNLDKHMAELDKAWRKAEGRKPVAELTAREKMLEGRIPWNTWLQAALTAVEQITEKYPDPHKDQARKFWEKALTDKPETAAKLMELIKVQSPVDPQGIEHYLAPLPIPNLDEFSEEDCEKQIKALCDSLPAPRLLRFEGVGSERLYPRETDHSVVSEGNISPTPSGPHVGPDPSVYMTLSEIDAIPPEK